MAEHTAALIPTGPLGQDAIRHGQIEGEDDKILAVMRDDDDAPLTREQIEREQRELAKLSEPTVLESLRASYINCAPKDGKLPSPRAVQSFLSVWKVLWRWKQNSRR